MRGVSTLRAKGTCVRPVALATMNTIERRIMTKNEASTMLPHTPVVRWWVASVTRKTRSSQDGTPAV